MNYKKMLIPAALAVALTGCNEEPKTAVEAKSPAAMQSPAEAASEMAGPGMALDSQKQRYSYAMGARLANLLKGQMDSDMSQDAIAAAISDVFSGTELKMTDAEMKASIVVHAKAAQEAKIASGQANLAKGQAFLEENKAKEGVKTLESGLQYKEITAGEGTQPTVSDTVTVHYKGSLIDGTVFDSSYQRGEPTSFPLGGVIPGFKEALLQMKPGGKSIAYIPSVLGYGERGAGGSIGSNETLVFEIELIKVTPAKSE